jgi:hexosaminidase
MRKTPVFNFAAIALSIAVPACRVATTPRAPAQPQPEVSVIPRPLQLEMMPRSFSPGPGMVILVESADERAVDVARYLAERLGAAAGGFIPVSTGSQPAGQKAIVLADKHDSLLGTEGYRLSVQNDQVRLESPTPAGLFYGVQTILQLLPAEVYAGKMTAGPLRLPCLVIRDSPRFRWRGFMLDVSRHFHPKEYVLKLIDYLAMHKMNTFHWHLTDDQGWRIEIKSYPLLTEVGAWRVDRGETPWTLREQQKDGETPTYGGFYTQEDIREVIAYAQSRFITIIPEIEMPGHCLAALASYPQYSCSGGPFKVPPGSVWPIKDVFCPGNDETFAFLEGVLGEVADLFPSPYIHIGGDEVDKSTWKACPKCQARLAAEGLKTEEELQSYFVKRVEKFLNSRGKTLLGWDEILEGGLAPNAAVMSWRGTEGGIAAARAGHDVVMSPTSHCYFDYYQDDPLSEPLGIGGFLPLRKVYSFEPVPPELNDAEAAHIMGAQANLWTEYVLTSKHAEYMTFPRIAALAEIGWTSKENRDWTGFTGRMEKQFGRYERAGINYSRSAYAVRVFPELDSHKREFVVKLETDTHRPDVRFTLDGSEPVASSRRYEQPLRLKKTGVLKAAAFLDGRMIGKPAEERLYRHLGLGLPASLTFPYKEQYSGGGPLALSDGLRGSRSPGDGRWQGFDGADLIAVIDLGQVRKIGRIASGFLQNAASWIFLPSAVEFAVSEDGKEYTIIATQANDVAPLNPEPQIKEFSAQAAGHKVRFVRVHARAIGVCPAGHPGAGDSAWLFADEITIE